MTTMFVTVVCAPTAFLPSSDPYARAAGAGAVRGVMVSKKRSRRLIMKKLVLAAVLSAFSYTAAATYACDGMKGHEKSEKSDTQAKKDGKKDSSKTDQQKS
jgi:uncharacterized membrane protein YebE (DUF533 family)